MRGKEALLADDARIVRITPAYAGKRNALLCLSCRTKDHPRVCGEKALSPPYQRRTQGSPPRMRGKGFVHDGFLQLPGITPAYAGKSACFQLCEQLARDHPRVCGEKPDFSGLLLSLQGSPPRMRGKATNTAPSTPWNRITPAYAGKRYCITCSSFVPEDHPRVCGEKYMGVPTKVKKPGSPPRMRGKVYIRINGL